MSTPDLNLQSLSVEEQLNLIDRLWENIAQAAAHGDEHALIALDGSDRLAPEILAEFRRRIEDHRRDPTTGISWEALNAELKSRFG
jgi:putative addiction module component (TIGR02574 family)